MGIKYQILIEIDVDGEIKMETKGLKGPSCMEELEVLMQNIAGEKEIKKTQEYYEKTNRESKQKINRFSK